MISKIALALAALALPAAAAAQVGTALPGTSAPAMSADLRTIAEAFSQPQLMASMLGPAMETVERRILAADAHWQELEREYPGLTEVRIDALSAAALERLPEAQNALTICARRCRSAGKQAI
jgi:hypothetical protein